MRGLELENAPQDQIRILKDIKPGSEIKSTDDYVVRDGGEDGGEVRDPQEMYRALQVFPRGVTTAPAVGFFGATEVRLHQGPIRLGVPYRKTGKVVCVGASPKTEFAWFDSALSDKKGKLVAEMRHMTRWMKVSSPLWQA